MPATLTARSHGAAPDVSAEPIETWPQWRDWQAGVVRREYDCTLAEAQHAAEHHRDLYDAYAERAFEAGRDFTPQGIRTIPMHLMNRLMRTDRALRTPMTRDPRENPLRRYLDRRAELITAEVTR